MEILLLILGVSCLGIVYYVKQAKHQVNTPPVIVTPEPKSSEEITKTVEVVAEEVKVLAEEVKPVEEVKPIEEAKVVAEEVKPVEEVKPTKAKKTPKSPAKAEVAAKRTRKSGKFVGDDKSTLDINEAFKDGKTPAKKAKTTKTKSK